MTRPVLEQTRVLIGSRGEHCESRSLFMDRFADPAAKDEARRDWFQQLCAKRPQPIRAKSGPWWPERTVVLKAQLQSRLLVDTAGGVMENAGLCLDRFGLPRIRGSAVKGCARTAVLRFLRQWMEEGSRPGGADSDDPWSGLPADPEPFVRLAVRVFGAVKEDFSPKGGDWFWAVCGRKDLVADLGKASTAGTIAFLDGEPFSAPASGDGLRPPPLGALEIDVLTSHHRSYYQGDQKVALDDEEPNPVTFPAVAAGHFFQFTLIPLRRAETEDLAFARACLAAGLQEQGIGAKTAAGYGWFRVLSGEEESDVPQQTGDYPSEKSFQGAVLSLVNEPQKAENFRKEIAKLQKPENQVWRDKLIAFMATPEAKTARKRLKKKDWFPKDWLPS